MATTGERDWPAADPSDGASKANTPPSAATIQYPDPDGAAAIPTIGWFNRMLPVEPWNEASPKEKMPPSRATSQYPRPDGVDAIPTIGWLSLMLPVDPWKEQSA